MPYEPQFQSLSETTPLWRQLWDELRETVHPPPEPDLKLESKPVPVKNIWSPEPTLGKRAGSVVLHVAVIAILMLPIWRSVRPAKKPQQAVELVMPTLMAPGPSLPKMRHLAGGAPPVHRIAPPKFQPVVAAPMHFDAPIKLMPATANPNVPLPQVGEIGAIAGPPGTSAGNGGAGPGGAGSGNGGGNCTNGPCGVGGDVTEPVPIYEPDPEYSDAARKAKFEGTVIVGVIIGTDGHVYDPKIVQPLGLGLDQKALDAVKLWRFEPAKKNGRPVRVAANIEVNFHLY